MSSSVR